jgi:CBS domain-containing protein
MQRTLSKEAKLGFRDNLRMSRSKALADAEESEEILFALEQLGLAVTGRVKNLGHYKDEIEKIAQISPLSLEIPNQFRSFFTPFKTLFELVKDGRDMMLHQGARARHLAQHTVELCLVLEDALASEALQVQDFMVREVVVAELWQPLALIRQKMLINSFSYLPFWDGNSWQVLSDVVLSTALLNKETRNLRLATPLAKAISEFLKIETVQQNTLAPEANIKLALEKLSSHFPVLVVSEESKSRLLGIITAFDLL